MRAVCFMLYCHCNILYWNDTERVVLLVDGADLVDAVKDALDKSDDDRLEALLCGAVKTLRATRSKPDSALFLALMCLAKSRPTLFHSDVVTEVLHC